MGGWILVEPGTEPYLTSTIDRAVDLMGVERSDAAISLTTGDYPNTNGDVSTHIIDPDGDTWTDHVLRSTSAWVKVLGDVEVQGWLEAPTRRVITELAVYLALHPTRLFSGDELRNALWPETDATTEASARSLRTYMSELRRVLGAELLPSARGGGYRFSSAVVSDWAMVQHLVGQSLVEGLDSLGQRELLYEALWLVRGRPFSGVNYNWVFSELLLSEIEGTIRKAAIRLFDLCIEDSDYKNALFALRKGLFASPYDEYLWGNALSLSAEFGPPDLERMWKECQATLGEHNDLEDHFNELVTKGPTSTWTQ